MTVLRYILMSILLVAGIVITASVILQESKSAGLGSLGGMQETYWNKNAGRSKEGLLNKITLIAVIVFFVISFALNINF